MQRDVKEKRNNYQKLNYNTNMKMTTNKIYKNKRAYVLCVFLQGYGVEVKVEYYCFYSASNEYAACS